MANDLIKTSFQAAIHDVGLYGLILMDLEGRIITWNRGAFDLLGFREAEVLGQKFDFIFNLEDRERKIPQQEMSRALRDGHAYDDRWHVRADKTQIYVNGGLCLLKSGSGEAIGFVKIIRDQTERKEHIERIEELNKQLLQARNELEDYAGNLESMVVERTRSLNERNQEMQDFCYSIAHDLRAPLRSIQAMSEVVLEDYSQVLDEAGKDYLGRIAKAGEKLDRLTLDLLAYTRFSREEIQLAPISLESVLDEVLLSLAEIITLKEASLNVQRPLPWIVGQPSYLAQILSNLISNSLKFIPAGVKPSISIWSEINESRVRLFVKDNGIGIAPEFHSKVFALFERLNPHGEHEGTGAGLAIARKAAQRMSGEVGIQPSGEGSIFWLELEKAE